MTPSQPPDALPEALPPEALPPDALRPATERCPVCMARHAWGEPHEKASLLSVVIVSVLGLGAWAFVTFWVAVLSLFAGSALIGDGTVPQIILGIGLLALVPASLLFFGRGLAAATRAWRASSTTGSTGS
jgi:hypothetical protein